MRRKTYRGPLRKNKKRSKRDATKVRSFNSVSSKNLTVAMVLTYNTVYASTTAVVLAQAFTFTTATLFTGYANFAVQVTNLYNEYRCERIRLRIVPVPGLSSAGLYPTGVYSASFEGPTTPTADITTIQRFPNHSLKPLFDKIITLQWTRTNDMEDRAFSATTAASPILGGIVGYIGAAAPTLGTSFMTIEASYLITCQGRKL
jgi:hypothetical protein